MLSCWVALHAKLESDFIWRPANQQNHLYAEQILRSGPEVIKLFSCSTQLSTKFILLINFKMPTFVGILTFISMINMTSERLKARNYLICP